MSSPSMSAFNCPSDSISTSPFSMAQGTAPAGTPRIAPAAPVIPAGTPTTVLSKSFSPESFSPPSCVGVSGGFTPPESGEGAPDPLGPPRSPPASEAATTTRPIQTEITPTFEMSPRDAIRFPPPNGPGYRSATAPLHYYQGSNR